MFHLTLGELQRIKEGEGGDGTEGGSVREMVVRFACGRVDRKETGLYMGGRKGVKQGRKR